MILIDNIGKALRTTKEANAILTKAGGVVIKSSFNTAKKLAVLYKDASIQTFNLGKDVVKTTVTLALDNQKKIIKTSGTAIKEAAKSIREGAEPELETMTKAKVKNAGKKGRKRSIKKEITIDDLLE